MHTDVVSLCGEFFSLQGSTDCDVDKMLGWVHDLFRHLLLGPRLNKERDRNVS